MADMNYKLGVISSVIDERDYTPASLGLGLNAVVLPDNFEVIYHGQPKNQKDKGTCVPHGLSELKECDNYDKTGVFTEFSTGFICANRSTTDYLGVGMQIREALLHLISDGDCLQVDFPYNLDYPDVLIPFNPIKSSLMAKAKLHKSSSCLSLGITNFDEIKAFIYKYKKPIIISIYIYQSFYGTNRDTGIVPLASGGYYCRHCVLCTGWMKDSSLPEGSRLKILNTMGTGWGKDGYGYIPNLLTEAWGVLDNTVIPIPVKTATYYKVQTGAFSNKDLAVKLSEKINSQGIATCLVYINNLWKVQCGCFKVKNNAITMQNKLISLGYKGAFVTTITK